MSILPKLWLIRNTKFEAYWAAQPPEHAGWTYRAQATRFDETEKATTQLPEDGAWERLL